MNGNHHPSIVNEGFITNITCVTLREELTEQDQNQDGMENIKDVIHDLIENRDRNADFEDHYDADNEDPKDELQRNHGNMIGSNKQNMIGSNKHNPIVIEQNIEIEIEEESESEVLFISKETFYQNKKKNNEGRLLPEDEEDDDCKVIEEMATHDGFAHNGRQQNHAQSGHSNHSLSNHSNLSLANSKCSGEQNHAQCRDGDNNQSLYPQSGDSTNSNCGDKQNQEEQDQEEQSAQSLDDENAQSLESNNVHCLDANKGQYLDDENANNALNLDDENHNKNQPEQFRNRNQRRRGTISPKPNPNNYESERDYLYAHQQWSKKYKCGAFKKRKPRSYQEMMRNPIIPAIPKSIRPKKKRRLTLSPNTKLIPPKSEIKMTTNEVIQITTICRKDKIVMNDATRSLLSMALKEPAYAKSITRRREGKYHADLIPYLNPKDDITLEPGIPDFYQSQDSQSKYRIIEEQWNRIVLNHPVKNNGTEITIYTASNLYINRLSTLIYMPIKITSQKLVSMKNEMDLVQKTNTKKVGYAHMVSAIEQNNLADREGIREEAQERYKELEAMFRKKG